jgi:hypothetical protein
VGTFNIVLLDLLCHFSEVNCDEPNNVLRVTFSKMLVKQYGVDEHVNVLGFGQAVCL